MYSKLFIKRLEDLLQVQKQKNIFYNINIKNNIFSNENYYQLQFTNINFTSPEFHLSNNLYYRYGNTGHTE